MAMASAVDANSDGNHMGFGFGDYAGQTAMAVGVSLQYEKTKLKIIEEIENDFNNALEGINKLPDDSRLGVYTAYKYYKKLLFKLKRTSSLNIKRIRIRIPNYQKIAVLAKSYLKFHLKLI